MIEVMSKANMNVVERLLNLIDNWEEVIIPRHVKFVDAYFRYNKNLKLAGSEFHFTENDMLFIFWRIQKSLQEEFGKRLQNGTIKNKPYVYKTTSVPRKKQVVESESFVKPIISLCQYRQKSLNK